MQKQWQSDAETKAELFVSLILQLSYGHYSAYGNPTS
jgi:hypothetical protein